MQFRPRFLGVLGLADIATTLNAAVGFVAIVVAPAAPDVAARLILLAAVADGLDGVLARRYGSTCVGEFVDSLADVVSFGVAPAVLVTVLVRESWADPASGGLVLGDPVTAGLALGIPALYVAAAVVRLACYTALDLDARVTEGAQTTLAATVLASAYLAGLTRPALLVGVMAVFAYLMVTRIGYPDLLERDAMGMGTVQIGAIVTPTFAGHALPRLLFGAALAYLLLAPSFYPRADDRDQPAA